MLAEIITIGDEILIGQTIDTNSAWLGEQLNAIGIDIVQITTINDKRESIIAALSSAEQRADIILMTGGLGPTKDDITKKTLAEYFKVNLIEDNETLENVESIFKKAGRQVLTINKEQALVPSNCEIIKNLRGTAPGLWFEENGKMYASMPGVPYEMKGLMQEGGILQRLSSKVDHLQIIHATITVVDIPESVLSSQIEDIEDNLPSHIKLAYLPHLNLVRLRLTGKSQEFSKSKLEEGVHFYLQQIKDRIGNNWFEGSQSISAVIGELLKKGGKSIGTIESCSSGLLASTITNTPGSSAYFVGSLLTYAYAAKVNLADIPQDLLNEVGAVSEEVAKLMAANARKKLGVDYCISTTGIAGPGGGTPTKPVGLVYIGLALPNGTVIVKKCKFRGTRKQIIERTSYTALNMLRMELQSISSQS